MKNKRSGKLTPVSADLKSVLRRIGQGQSGVHPEIWARWSEIVGHDIAGRAFPRKLEGGVLTVAVSNSAWMQELSYLKPRLLDRFEEEVGKGVVAEIRLVLAPFPDKQS